MDQSPSIDTEPLYNIRLIKGYVEYLERNYPEVDLQAVLDYSGISPYEYNDMGFWFSQQQADRFYACVLQKTANANIAREAGRMGATAASYTAFRQYAFGFVTPAIAYGVIAKLAMTLTRGGTFETKRLDSRHIEVVARPAKGVNEKPYQCENRLGILEAIALPFTGRLAEIRHDECLHKGGSCCRYEVSWRKAGFYSWLKLRNLVLILTLIGVWPVMQYLPELIWPWLGCGGAVLLGLSLLATEMEKRDLVRNLEAQGNAAEQLINETNNRYNDALLVQEIGQAISAILDEDEMFDCVMQALKKYSGFDRGLVMLGDASKTRLRFRAAYGFNAAEMQRLKMLDLDLAKDEYNGPLVRTFRRQIPTLINDVQGEIVELSPASRSIIEDFSSASLISVPISHRGEALGVLYVDNLTLKQALGQSQINHLTGVAQQLGISLVNARSFEALQRSETQYRELVENANSLIMRIDRRGRLVFFNEYAQRFFGYSARKVLDKELIGSVIPKSSPAARVLRQAIDDGEAVTGLETEVAREDATPAWISWNIRPLKGGRTQEFLCIGSNITQQKQLEARLRQRQKTEAIGTLAAGIAHDFNNILFPILGYAEMSLDDVAPDSLVHANLEQITRAARRAKELVEQILLFSRKDERELKALILRPVVKEALKLLRASLPSTIRIVQKYDDNCPPVDADPTQIHQIVMNLCANAAHAMKDSGELRVSLSIDRPLAVDQDQVFVCLAVADNGSGIRPENLEKIFDPYFTTKAPGEGSGMGLSVVQGIVSRMGGRIEVESKVGIGTEFKIFMPRSHSLKAETVYELHPAVPRGSERIMVVDDENFVAEMEQQMLERLGYRVRSFTDSAAALDHFKSEDGAYDLVVTDQIMPDLTGLEMVKQMNAIKPGLPVILCTGFSTEFDEQAFKDCGIKEIVIKPIEALHLGQAIRRALDS